MANTKEFFTRIQHKHDIEENWLKATNFTPLDGEIIIYDIDDNYDYERIKVGDGITNVSALPFTLDLETFTDEEIDEICGANIVSSSEVTF